MDLRALSSEEGEPEGRREADQHIQREGRREAEQRSAAHPGGGGTAVVENEREESSHQPAGR